MDPDAHDHAVRVAAFDFLTQQRRLHGDALPRTVLTDGFTFAGQRVPLLAPQGIFKPAVLRDMPLSITTAPPSDRKEAPYDDQVDSDQTIHYRYRGTDPQHRDNVGLRLAMQRRAPLIYFFGLVPGRYMPRYPVYIVGDDAAALTFRVMVDDEQAMARAGSDEIESIVAARRAYVTVLAQRRLHQESFRQRVLRAYQERCAICRLHHDELLEAAHILPDGHPKGEPIVPNGLALCTLHHAAFDRNIIGVRPDLVVEVRKDVLEEVDGPMLLHGLQDFQNAQLIVPRAERLRPDREFLAERYDLFRRAV